MREFRKITGRTSRPIVWQIGIDPKDPTTYVVRWGLENGAMQETRDTPGTCGKKGHANYQTAKEYVKFCIDREIRKKTEQGFVEYKNGEALTKAASKIDFSKSLPKNLCFYKPKKEISDKALKELEESNRAVWTLKRDGMMHIVVKRMDNIEIYSRRMDLVTEKFPHIVESAELLDLPNDTILLGEMCFLKDDGSESFLNTSRICRSDPDLALAYQGFSEFPKRKKDESVLGKVSYYVFDIAFFQGIDLISTISIKERLVMLRELFKRLDQNLSIGTGRFANVKQLFAESKLREKMLREYHIAPLKIYKTDAGNDLELAKRLRAEGFVVLDVDTCYGNKAYSFDGKAQRPEGIWKRKPKYEDEFVIVDFYSGTGRNRGRLGGFFIKQLHPDTGKWIDCGKCGGGFKDNDREGFWQEGKKLIGQTIKIEFDSRQPPKDGIYSLRFPEFKGMADKEPSECFAQEDWPPRE